MSYWTPELLDAHYRKMGQLAPGRGEAINVPVAPAVNHKARGAVKAPGDRNKTEARYEQYLELGKEVGGVLKYWFQPITFKLADDLRYTPDFMVMTYEMELEFHDVKGTKRVTRKSGEKVAQPYSQEDAKIKAKIAAKLFPEFGWCFVFPLSNGEWGREEF
jgi:hypothetical protein